MFWVYRIEVDGITRYIGQTKNIDAREKQHNYLCFKKNKKKVLYNNIRIVKQNKIKLIPVKTFSTHIEAKRYEAFLILNDYFNKKELWQHIPKIKDGF
jgi:predicted GIY-YIG superfamily endonuclease